MRRERFGSIPCSDSRRNQGAGKMSADSLSGSGRLKKQESSAWPVIRYDRYRLNLPEFVIGLGKGAAACGVLTFTFYRSLRIFLWMLPLAFAGVILERKKRMERRKKELAGQFKESMMILASSLSAGYSVENALAVSREELTMLYGREGMIVQEFSFMVHQIKLNRSIEQALEDFSRRSGLEDVKNFAEVFSVAKRSSGDVGGIMRHTAEIIRDKMQVKEEILTMTASRQFEQRIMNMIPFFIVFYVESASPGFFGQMYGTSMGRVLMSGCLIVYLISYILSKRILEIEV